ncbi:MAG: transcription elongation factor GreB [Betaproteobacteria bacterium]|nr:transcription elongation factor GreB [Betaproteobacteria bacterium]
MSKAFTRESDEDGEELPASEPATPLGKNYLTPAGYARLRRELKDLVEVERPEVVRTVSWAAANGDRSENGDYIYGKRRLREIDRRIRYLMKRLEVAEVVDPLGQEPGQVFFGATVTYCDQAGARHTISIVGTDEVDPARGRVSWVSPVAKALLRSREGETVTLRTPAGIQELEVIEIRYDPLL